MVKGFHVPDKRAEKFDKLLKEAKRLSGASYHRLLETALIDLILKLRKESLKRG